MKTRNFYYIAAGVFSLIVSPSLTFSQTTLYGGRGLLRTHSAETIGKSQFYVNTYFGTFLESTRSKSTLGKDHTLTLGLTFGLGRSLELTALLTPYQDDQQHIWGPPGDSQLGLKFRTPLSGSSVLTAVRIFTSFPTARSHNVPFEPYSSGKIGFGITGIMSFDMTQSFPLFPLKAHLNFGYMDHNMKDALFSDEEDQFLLLAGLKFPIRSSILYTEYSAEVFANNPAIPSYAFNSQRLTQGLKLLGPWDLIFDFAVDISLSKKPNAPSSIYLKTYADWKFLVGINYQMLFSRPDRRSAENHKKAKADAQQKQRMEDVHQKRQSVKDELERMEQSLEKDKKKKKNDDGNDHH